jgi:hypothetical protein
MVDILQENVLIRTVATQNGFSESPAECNLTWDSAQYYGSFLTRVSLLFNAALLRSLRLLLSSDRYVNIALEKHITAQLVWRCSFSAQVISFFLKAYYTLGTAVAQWLKDCATNREVAGSIPDGFIGIFHWHNPSDRTMTLGSTQPFTEMSTRSISWGVKAAVA